MTDLSRRADLTSAQLEALATAGPSSRFGLDRRQALWSAGFAESADHVAGTTPAPPPPTLPGMSEVEVTLADLWATGVSPERHPVEHLRERAAAPPASARSPTCSARRAPAAGCTSRGLITHRQRPGTAQGVTFLNLEDETGMLNVVCSIGVMKAHRQAARNRVAVVVRGILERNEGATNLVADRVVLTGHRRRPAPARSCRPASPRATSADRQPSDEARFRAARAGCCTVHRLVADTAREASGCGAVW